MQNVDLLVLDAEFVVIVYSDLWKLPGGGLSCSIDVFIGDC